MKRFSSIATTAMVILVLLSASLNAGLMPIAHAANFNAGWLLNVTGLVDQPLTLSIADLIALPQTTLFAQIFCVGPPGFFVEEGNWTGVKLGLLLEEAGISPDAAKVAFYASDGFTTDLAIASAMDDNVIVAYEKDGNALDENLRLVVPGRWGYKWIFNLDRIEVVSFNFLGKYETQGYSDSAEMSSSGAPSNVGSLLPGRNTLNRNYSTPAPSQPPQNSPPLQFPSPPPTQNPPPSNPPETGFEREGIAYTVAIAAVIILIIGLVFYSKKSRKRPLENQDVRLS